MPDYTAISEACRFFALTACNTGQKASLGESAQNAGINNGRNSHG
jgi:hypothetical protein